MLTIPQLENDVFISYAHLDNKALIEGQQGWITAFHRALHNRLGQLLGREPKIWRDDKIRGNDIFGEETIAQLHKLKTLISIISPRYVDSDWCRKELQKFHYLVGNIGRVSVGNNSRIFKIIKTPVSHDLLPIEVNDILGYEFFKVEESGRFHEFHLDKNSPHFYEYLTRFEDLAQDLCLLIKRMEQSIAKARFPEQATEQASSPMTIYLARACSDLVSERDNILRDLEISGYTVLPDRELPLNSRFSEAVLRFLSRSALAVHVIGSKYGSVPEGENRSIIELQERMSHEAAVPRLIWMPVGTVGEDDRQNQFIASLYNDSGAQNNTEILCGELEDFKTHLHDTLANLATPHTKEVSESNARPLRVYLVYDEMDIDAVVPIDDYLYEKGIEILQPLFEGDERELREAHKDNLRLCDAALIYYDRGSAPWFSIKFADLRKIAGLGRNRPIHLKAVYVSGAETPHKQRIRSHEAIVIKHFEPFLPETLNPFMAQLQHIAAF